MWLYEYWCDINKLDDTDNCLLPNERVGQHWCNETFGSVVRALGTWQLQVRLWSQLQTCRLGDCLESCCRLAAGDRRKLIGTVAAAAASAAPYANAAQVEWTISYLNRAADKHKALRQILLASICYKPSECCSCLSCNNDFVTRAKIGWRFCTFLIMLRANSWATFMRSFVPLEVRCCGQSSNRYETLARVSVIIHLVVLLLVCCRSQILGVQRHLRACSRPQNNRH